MGEDSGSVNFTAATPCRVLSVSSRPELRKRAAGSLRRPPSYTRRAVNSHTELLHVLLAMLAVLLVAQCMGRLFTHIGQPAVIGEMVAGILLGPSLLGRVWPSGEAFLLPSTIEPHLRVIAQIGVVLYMFLVGLELDVSRLRARAGSAVVISCTGIAVPLLLGSAIAGFLHARVSSPSVPPWLFGAFFCVALSVTAFPVLARIVAERKLDKSPMGTMALTCAAADDIAAWCMLSIVVSFARSRPSDGLVTVLLAALYVAIMVGIVRRFFVKFVERRDREPTLSRAALSSVFIALLVSALLTEWIGIHALFGAFLLGALVPAHSQLAQRVTAKLEDVVSVLLLPMFFALTGLRTQLGLLAGLDSWLLCGLIVLVAFAGKLGGVFVAARLCGMGSRSALGLGALMNTRGLMELIVLNVGLDLGIISSALFTMMVIMALVTTCAAGPLLALLAPGALTDESKPTVPA
jgi:Kef-type K+ transport system membrane component KefB